MEDVDPKDYCSKKPHFPKTAYIVFLFFSKDEKVTVFPMKQVYPDLEIVKDPIIEIVEHIKKKRSEVEVSFECAVVPISFKKIIPLKREYWEGQHESYNYDFHLSLFIRLLHKPEFHKLLVVPTDFFPDLNYFKLEAALPLKITAGDIEIEQFIKGSDYEVHETASHAAIYFLNNPFSYNWETGKVRYPERKRGMGDSN